ncbi:hypothetical protein GCM10009654_06320 [Streptomyces hebeiensis]|uniref:5'-nucleotidase n=1 Tax=Streptomyces hebeiensis TaxID=229486 RepID=A0ABN1UKE3_9ACTN
MYKRMLRAVVATAFSAALAYGALTVGGDIGWHAEPTGPVAQGVESGGDIGWNVEAGAVSAADATNGGDIGWIVSPRSAPGDIGWNTTPADSGA